MLTIKKQNKDNNESIIRKFNSLVKSEGVLEELKEKRYHLNNQEKKILKRKKRQKMLKLLR